METLPIDIHYNKLLDWLVNRRHCKAQWHVEVKKIQEKINTALIEIPKEEELTVLLHDTNIHYFHCLQIVDKLKATDSGKTNLFGQYSSQKMQDWVNIIKMYERDGIYLGECAQLLSRNVNYEIPALKKQMSKCNQVQEESIRKERDYSNNAVSQRKNYQAACKKMGIEGNKVKTELAALVRDLPTEFDKMAKSSKQLESSVLYYDQFISHVMNRADLYNESLQVLKHIQCKGNTTTYEWKTGVKPARVEQTSLLIDTSDENETVDNPDDIDWGGDVEAIDFGGDQLDFGEIDITVESGGDETNEGEINWDVESSEKVETTETITDGVASGENAMSMLENPTTRNMLIDDLLELEAFLSQRLLELMGDSSVLSDNQFQSSPESIQLDATQVQTLLNNVQDVIQMLTNIKMQHLFLIQNSPRYVIRVADNLKQILVLADKMNFLEKQMVIRRHEALEEWQNFNPKLDLLIKRTKELQKQLEGEISKKYKDRLVNIMGDVNTI